jgi:SulP family sulfate permease
VVLVGLRHVAPRVPAPLVAVALGLVAVSALDLADSGVAVVGAVPSGLPGFDAPSMDQWRLLAPGAAGIALISAVESLAAARALATRDDDEINADRELVALGAANLGGGFFQAYAAGGGLSQSAVNDDAGARSQMSQIATVGVVVLVLTLLTGVLENLAQATLSALVIVAASGLVNPADLRRLARVRIRDFGLALVALAGVLAFGVLEGVLVAVVVSLAVLLYQANRPMVEVVDADAGLLALRPRGTLYFANVGRVRDQIIAAVDAQARPPEVVVIDVVAVPDLEVTALEVLARLGDDLRARGTATWVAGLSRPQREMVDRFGIDPKTRLFDAFKDAITAYESGR